MSENVNGPLLDDAAIAYDDTDGGRLLGFGDDAAALNDDHDDVSENVNGPSLVDDANDDSDSGRRLPGYPDSYGTVIVARTVHPEHMVCAQNPLCRATRS